MPRPLIIAHRGASEKDLPENSLVAFQAALKLKIDMIEFDLRITKDLKIIAFHDQDIQGKPLVNWTHAEVNQYLGYEAPTLAEILQLNWGKIRLDIELKETGYEEQILNKLNQFLEPEQYVIKSFLDQSLFALHQLAPHIRTGLLLGLSSPPNPIQTRWQEFFPEKRLKTAHAHFVSPHFRLLHFAFIHRMHRLGYPVYVWTLNSLPLITKCLKLGVDGIITDFPQKTILSLNITNT